ncbi:MAG TPA: DUF4097 family beta strand repeat-containing protein [Vicinamibacteria bacterium]|nr:DUF4097 family beta strand repeat-containing protein [Vicinamibacteria bacterium]
MKASKILLLLAILFVGGMIEAVRVVRGHADLGPTGCRVLAGKFYGPSFPFESEQRHAVAPGTGLDVENAFGAVRVVRGAPGEIHLKLRTVVFRATEDEARAFADRVRATAAPSGTALRIVTNREELQRADQRIGFETHMELAVPPDTAVTVRNEHGLVDVADVAAADLWGSFDTIRLARVAGPAVIKGRHGAVWVSGVEGALSLSNRHGAVEIEDVADVTTVEAAHGAVSVRRTGALTVQGEHGDVEVETVRGNLEIRSQHARVTAREVDGGALVESSFGDVHVERVTGEVRARVAHGRLTVRDVKGAVFAKASFNDVVLQRIGGAVEVSVEHGGVQAEALESGGRVEAAGNEVSIDGFRGPLAVQAQRGRVELVPAGPLQSAVTVRATHGGIRLEVPAGSRFTLEAEARRGGLAVDVPGLAITHAKDSRLTGQLGGGGELVQLTAENGEVRLEPRVEVAHRQSPPPTARP